MKSSLKPADGKTKTHKGGCQKKKSKWTLVFHISEDDELCFKNTLP